MSTSTRAPQRAKISADHAAPSPTTLSPVEACALVARQLRDPSAPLSRELSAPREPRYQAPEETRGAPCDGPARVYVAGLVLFELIAWVSPYAAIHPCRRCAPATAIRAHRHGVPRRLRNFGDFGRDGTAVQNILDKALAKDPARRHSSPHAFAEALERITGRTGTQAPIARAA